MLIVCCTPLQTLIARAMLDAAGVSRFRLIYYTWIDNEKHRRYFERLSANAEKSAFVHLNSRFPAHFIRFRKAFHAIGAREVDTIAFAAIDNVYIQHAIQRFTFREIVTFDDGTANIAPQSAYFVPRKRSPLHEVGGFALRGGKNLEWIRTNSARHYTIYPGVGNIVPDQRLIPLSLFDSCSYRAASEHAGGTLRVFLGQPIEDVKDPTFSDWYMSLIEKLKIDEYLPHPRESRLPNVAHVIKTPLIAEEYLLDRLKKFSSIEVLTIASTTLLNIDTVRARRIVVQWPRAGVELQALYSLFEKRGCELANEAQLDFRKA